VVILLVPIVGYSTGGYCWLLVFILLVTIGVYFIHGYVNPPLEIPFIAYGRI
jgi:hypothetical protein